MINRPLYTRKYRSGRLKEYGYRITNTFDESKSLNEIIAVADNQILKTMRDVQKRTIDKDKLEILIKTRDMYSTGLTYQQSEKGISSAMAIARKLKSVKTKNALTERLHKKYVEISVNTEEAKKIQDKINRMLFQPDYVTVGVSFCNYFIFSKLPDSDDSYALKFTTTLVTVPLLCISTNTENAKNCRMHSFRSVRYFLSISRMTVRTLYCWFCIVRFINCVFINSFPILFM